MIKMVISARRTWEANPRTNVETSVWRHWWLFDRLWPIDHAWLWILYDDDDQKNVGDKSKHNAPDWESAKWGFSTLVDPVEDEHLVQIEDHPERDIDEGEEILVGMKGSTLLYRTWAGCILGRWWRWRWAPEWVVPRDLGDVVVVAPDIIISKQASPPRWCCLCEVFRQHILGFDLTAKKILRLRQQIAEKGRIPMTAILSQLW